MNPLSPLALVGLLALASHARAQTDLATLTTSPKLWETGARDFSDQVSDVVWEDGSENYPRISNSKELTLWNEPVESIKLGETSGVLTELKILVLGNESSMLMEKSDFNKRASKWKTLLDEKLGSKGKVMPPISVAEIKHMRVGWKRDNHIAILSANIGAKPDSLEVSFFEMEAGLARLRLKGQQAAEPPEENGSDPAASKEEKKILDEVANISAREASSGIPKEAQDALNLLNVYRFLSGVSSDVEIDNGMQTAAEDAVMICKEKGTISHDFGHSTDKCSLAMVSGNFTMVKSVTSYMEDRGDGNRANRGHRRSCLNHLMGKTGFALDLPYSAMYAFDNSGKAARENYSYPGHGLYPIKYLHGNGWTYHLVSGDAPSECEVEVWRLNQPEDKLPGWSNEPDGTKLPCAYVNTYADTIVFEPQSEAITQKGHYLVRLKGGGLKEQYLVKLF